MATYVKFQQFVEDLLSGVHDLSASGDTLKVYLTNNSPDVANDAVKTDLAGITEENGYAPEDIQNSISRSGGTASLVAVDVTFTASGGSFGPFRYAVIYNDTPTSPADPLVAYYDHGSSISIADTKAFIVDFGASLFTLA